MKVMLVALFFVVTSSLLPAQDLKVSYFIVGRLRTIELTEGLPFKITIFTVKRSLLGQNIRFHMVDLEHYVLHYRLGDSEITREGNFEEELRDPNFRLIVKKDPLLNAGNAGNLNLVEYMFKIQVK